MEPFQFNFSFSTCEIIAISLLIIVVLVQLFFYFNYYRKPLTAVRKEYETGGEYAGYTKLPKVSIIIESENEARCLEENLPMILEQDYPDFEVIIINNGSTDETYELIESLKLKYPNLYDTYIPGSYDKAFGRRKLAYTLGAKAAKGDVLLFTEPYSKPQSNKWIMEMAKQISDKIEVVLGYSYYAKESHFYNRVARFDNHIFSMQYLSLALINKPFTGVYRNVAFKKSLFFDNKGFSSYLNLENSEDVFINHIVNEDNTVVVMSQDSFVCTTLNSYSLWRRLKKSYSVAKTFFKSKLPLIFSVEYFSRYVFYALTLACIIYACIHEHWAFLSLTIFIFMARMIGQFTVINSSARYFGSGKFYFSLILMDIVQPIYNLRFRTRHKMVKGR